MTLGLMAVLHPALSSGQTDAFASALRSYVDLHRAAAVGLPSDVNQPEAAQNVQAMLAGRIQARRQDPRPGDIFGPGESRIRDAIREETTGPNGKAALSSIEQTNVHGVRLRVNHRYPPGLPRVTMPGSILAKLPAVPPELEYRFLGRSLLLIDTRAGLVVDMLPDVLPAVRP